MLRSLLLSILLAGCGSAVVRENPRLAREPEIIWLGIDYTAAKMVGLGAFNQPDEIFPGYLKKWNGLFVSEMLGALRSSLGKPVRAEVSYMMSHNERGQASQIVEDTYLDGNNVTPADIPELVRRYNIEGEGVGLVFIVDVMTKATESACLYPTFIDLATLDVIDTHRGCYPARGMGFRNYWFNPVKEAARRL